MFLENVDGIELPETQIRVNQPQPNKNQKRSFLEAVSYQSLGTLQSGRQQREAFGSCASGSLGTESVWEGLLGTATGLLRF